MSDNSHIEWTDATWNPVSGCTKVSPRCDHCYAETLHEQFHGKGSFSTVTLHPERLDKPLHWRKPRRVFVNSMSDLFHAQVPDDYIGGVFAVMAGARRHHTFQILTKRHARMRSLRGGAGFRAQLVFELRYQYEEISDFWDDYIGVRDGALWPLPNVWLGVSVETQQWADIRIPALLDTPAAVRFLSAEPLLGPVNLEFIRNYGHDPTCGAKPDNHWGIDWVITGGESGPNARPMHRGWASALVKQCRAAGVPVFMEQMSSVIGPGKGGDVVDFPADLEVRQWPGEVSSCPRP